MAEDHGSTPAKEPKSVPVMADALGTALAAFIRDHEYCGELDTGVEGRSLLDDVLVRGEADPDTGAGSSTRCPCG